MAEENVKLNELILALTVPPIDIDAESKTYDASDFSSFTSSPLTLTAFNQLLDHVQCCERSSAISENISAKILVIIAQHSCQCGCSTGFSPWSSEDLRCVVVKLSEAFLSHLNCSGITEIMSADENGACFKVAQLALEQLADTVRPRVWRQYPAAAWSLFWLIQRCQGEILWKRLAALLPAVLLLLDDHEVRHQRAALAASAYILREVPPTRLRQLGRAAVLADAAQRVATAAPIQMTASDGVSVWLAALPVALKSLIVAHGVDSAPVLRHVRQFLLSMSSQSGGSGNDAHMRHGCLVHLRFVVDSLGDASVCWLRLILDVLAQYVDFLMFTEQTPSFSRHVDAVLDVITSLVDHCNQRLPRHLSQIHFILLKLFYDVTVLSPRQSTLSDMTQIDNCDALKKRLAITAARLNEICDGKLFDEWQSLIGKHASLPANFVDTIRSVCGACVSDYDAAVLEECVL